MLSRRKAIEPHPFYRIIEGSASLDGPCKCPVPVAEADAVQNRWFKAQENGFVIELLIYFILQIFCIIQYSDDKILPKSVPNSMSI